MDDRKRTRTGNDDVPVVGDYSDEQDAQLSATSTNLRPPAWPGRGAPTRAAAQTSPGATRTQSAAAPTQPGAARTQPAAARPAADRPAGRGGADGWRLDPRDVERHARLRRQRERLGPLGKALRYAAVVLALAGAFAVYWNFATLRNVKIGLPDLSALLPRSSSGDASAPASGGSERVEVEARPVVGTAAPTSLKSGARDREKPLAVAEAEPHAAPIVEPRDAPAAKSAPAAQSASTAESLPATESAPAAESAAVAASAPAAQSAPAAENPPAADGAPAAAAPAAVERAPEPPPAPETFAFALPKVTVSESDAAATVLILRNGGKRGVSSVTWWTSDGTAKAGSDYVDLGKVVVKFAAGEQNRAIHIPIVGDGAAEGAESFYVNLAAGDDASAEPQDRVEVVIEDDD
jgi:hypothetical protein